MRAVAKNHLLTEGSYCYLIAIVAAGVLVLDETRPLRPPLRRLRHTTNTEASQSHILRRMKRSHSGRALSSCLRDLHVLHPRSIQTVGKAIVSQEAIVSALKREVALAGKETNVNLTSVSTGTTPGGSPTGHAEGVPITSSALDPGSATKMSNMTGTSLSKHSENTTPRPPSPQPALYRRRRHGSLQIGTQHSSIRQEYGDGYIIFDDENRSFGRIWDRRDCEDQHHKHGLEGWNGNAEHIPSAIYSAFPNSRHALLPPYSHPHPHQPFTASTTPQTTGSTFTTAAAATEAPRAVEPMKTPQQAARFQPGESLPLASAAALSLASGLATNINVRSSTPAVMSGQIQYDWSRLPPTALPQEGNGGGYGPLDHVAGQHEGLAPATTAASVPILMSMALSPLLTIQTAIMSMPSAAAATSATTSSSWDSKSDPGVDKIAAAPPVGDLRVTMTESADGPMGCVVGQTMGLPNGATTSTKTMASKPKVVSRTDASDGVVSLSAASSPVTATVTTTTL